MAQPFTLDPQLLRLLSQFPSAEELRAALSKGAQRSREIVARLWLTEGVPCAFRSCPAIYEDMRGWVSARLSVHPKEITVVGSARIGYSLAPPPSFGKPFGEHSDLDLSVISASLFKRIVETFDRFADDYGVGAVRPRSAVEARMWEANLEFAKRNIPRGFLDASKVPNFYRYEASQQVNQVMWALLKKLEATAGAPRFRRASTRVYRDWQCFIDLVTLNLRAAVPIH